ncbi:TonB-dependent receptor domain-containing protein [Segetibacter koreensis]|uniref:TonB-dependent receptor domain-containing protein n=1 Tax=Segetibacter koreensis TaxID=398037 RepID=UPI00037464A5|nr:TonB-dependent receptor [Segetibacter koreensis]
MKKLLLAIAALVFVNLESFAQASNNPLHDTTVAFKVYGVCEQCKHRIENALKVKGITLADWNIDTKILSLSFDPSRISLEKIQNKITAAGHDTYEKKATDVAYNQLPSCCHYRETENMDDPAMNHGAGEQKSATHATDSVTTSSIATPGQIIKGVVLEEDKKGSFIPLAGASIMWLGTNQGTVTDNTGSFAIKHSGNRLIISYSGYKADTILVNDAQDLKMILATNNRLNEVKVTASKLSRYINTSTAFRTETMSEKELFKAACCNLSESFETNPSVDVSYNDAVTGSKQIQLLGLAGIYSQLTVENLPGPRGLATFLGLNSIPGTWVESIQLSKGTGSVANGYESIAGQINVELKKPQNSERLYANMYINDFGKTDLNLNLSQKISKKWLTALLLHHDFLKNNRLDFNKDGFRDLPTGNLFSAINRWSYDNNKGLMSQFGIKFLDDKKTGGQINYNPSTDKFTTNNYGLEINTRRVEGFGKLGYVFPQKKYQSIGLQLSAFEHKQNSYFGLTKYNAQQQNFYSNLIYQSIIHTTTHKFRTGFSYVYDKYNEDFKANNYKRTEIVPGAFFEYTYTPSDKFDVVAGLREDYNNLYGWFTTPRLNARYEPIKGTVIRVSAGRGQRTANIFAENNGVLISSRQVNIIAPGAGGAYGLQPEVAWNKGITVDQKFTLFHRTATVGVDFFRNDFTNQVVADVEDPRVIKFYNLNGKSYSNSLQAELSFIPVKRFDVRLAYRLFDVKTMYSDQLLQKPLTAQNRAFANLAYETNGWKFDYTVSCSGRKRLPSTKSNPERYQRPDYSPSFVVMNAQVSKTIGKKDLIDIYIGGENLTNYFQKNAIIAPEQTFSPYFDASMTWGPITGRMFYGGFRFRIK